MICGHKTVTPWLTALSNIYKIISNKGSLLAIYKIKSVIKSFLVIFMSLRKTSAYTPEPVVSLSQNIPPKKPER